MSFRNVELKKTANVYYEGKVTTRTLITAEGEMKSLGVMLPGVYRFATEAPEEIEILQGHCRVKLADEQAWSTLESGESFSVPGHSHYEIEVTDLLDYLCHFG